MDLLSIILFNKLKNKGGTKNNADMITLPDALTNTYNLVSLLQVIPELDLTNNTNAANLFKYCSNCTELSVKNTSSLTSCYCMFYQCTNLLTAPMFDTSSVTNMGSMFANCEKITTIPQYNTENVTDMSSMLNKCKSLTTLPILDTSSVTTMYKMFNTTYPSPLSDESLANLVVMIKNATNYTATKTLQYIGLTSTQATACSNLSDWADCVSAGWSTGY